MAAEILDEIQVDNADTDDLPTAEHAMDPAQVAESFAAPEPDEADELPEKYRGKSIKDIVSMHQEAEKLIGKHSGEVGELRQFVDSFIQNKLAETQTASQAPEEEEVDFFEDPKTAVSKAIDSHPAVRQATEQAKQYQQVTALTQLKAKHPDMPEVIGDPAFMEWVKSSKVRTELFHRADRMYDTDCADELLTQFKERKAANSQVLAGEKTQRAQQVRAASTGSASGSNTAGSKRIYRRADIIKLMKNDPDRYDALSSEILQAYRDNGVR